MKKKTAILLSAGILFVSGNLYLALKDDGKAVRSSYINNWAKIGKETLTETLHAEGVTTPEEETHVYYDPNSSEFKSFLVKEGDVVDSGTPLFEYSSDNIDKELARLEAEKDQLETEATLLDEQIKQLSYLQTVSASTTDNSLPVAGNGTAADSSNDLMAISIEKEIYDKELEKSRVEAEIEKYDDLIDSYDGSDQLEISSEVAGSVKKVNYELNNPIVTIISDTPKVEGTFSERDLKNVQEGMEVYVKTDMLKGAIGGTLTKIAKHPESDPSVKKESHFPFEIELELEEEEIVHGTHVDVSVVTNQVVNAAVVPQRSIDKGKKNSYVYILNEVGKVEKRKIKKGLEVGGKTELKKGVKPGELFVGKPENVQKADSPFFSKLKPGSLAKKTFKEEGKRDLFKHIMVGFFK
ncbi:MULTISPECIES: HlyD family efflux transporter periplasmic adaptor subunit [unclassified Mesobacillus]|uniref:efflux RND transporter periplasmic adaptor subunit n=1 Tax=unclassified Mesobacillus TaxID=2675270 RepID=UPI00204187DA|nr:MULTISPECIES: HlyD family efflux transporter periplasmic adaptor subunit [unclassified Mesobacillus]MCM3123824.1 HlyD family efflux transporter periplasmic adaptor subunit [Mesobacillus sp. MER 33]MCM3234161.1 HlyD family efflux transporter periplasmic adaptor subunit [Mesobacillus sp. MER 48]